MSARDEDGDRIDLEALERECDVEFLRGSGPGGQRRNKVETTVRLTHRPTATVVVAGDTPSQARNRKLALERMAERLQRMRDERAARSRAASREPTKPSRRARQRRLDDKKRRGELKRSRRALRPPPDD